MKHGVHSCQPENPFDIGSHVGERQCQPGRHSLVHRDQRAQARTVDEIDMPQIKQGMFAMIGNNLAHHVLEVRCIDGVDPGFARGDGGRLSVIYGGQFH